MDSSRKPEQAARADIDALLGAAGWIVQDYRAFNSSVGRGIALREVPLKTGPCDYLLLVDRKAVGVIEAKKSGTRLSGVADQSANYAVDPLDHGAPRQHTRYANARDGGLPGRLPLLCESTGVETFFRDERDPDPRSRRVFSFHRPETLTDWLAAPATLRARLAALPPAHPLPVQNLRACQVEGITNLEESFVAAHLRALIQMESPRPYPVPSRPSFATVVSFYKSK